MEHIMKLYESDFNNLKSGKKKVKHTKLNNDKNSNLIWLVFYIL